MASVLTVWCTTRQCEVVTGIWIDADTLGNLAAQIENVRCSLCGREHSTKNAYLRVAPAQSNPIAANLTALFQRRRPEPH
jgi:hypothetical protein